MRDTSVTIEGYLTERKLAEALAHITGDAWLGKQVKVPGTRMRWDMAFSHESSTLVVEYDGDEHYRNSIKIKGDMAKDQAARDLGYSVVRFPYWVQLDTCTLGHFFGLGATIVQDFPHGFITTKLFPASYCELGVERFARELDGLPSHVQAAVTQSIQDRAVDHGVEFVLPSGLRHIIGG
ncbi:hypothetical protein ACFL0Q_09355 [Thermodesulfobacteriota bacterium]